MATRTTTTTRAAHLGLIARRDQRRQVQWPQARQDRFQGVLGGEADLRAVEGDADGLGP
jgi:hypothetical protein